MREDLLEFEFPARINDGIYSLHDLQQEQIIRQACKMADRQTGRQIVRQAGGQRKRPSRGERPAGRGGSEDRRAHVRAHTRHERASIFCRTISWAQSPGGEKAGGGAEKGCGKRREGRRVDGKLGVVEVLGFVRGGRHKR